MSRSHNTKRPLALKYNSSTSLYPIIVVFIFSFYASHLGKSKYLGRGISIYSDSTVLFCCIEYFCSWLAPACIELCKHFCKIRYIEFLNFINTYVCMCLGILWNSHVRISVSVCVYGKRAVPLIIIINNNNNENSINNSQTIHTFNCAGRAQRSGVYQARGVFSFFFGLVVNFWKCERQLVTHVSFT